MVQITNVSNRVPLRKEYAQIVEWVRPLSHNPVAPFRIAVMCKSLIEVAHIQLMIGNNNYIIHIPFFLNSNSFRSE